MGYYSERTCPECLSIPCTDLCGVECECNEEYHEDCAADECECYEDYHEDCADDECECRHHEGN